MANSSLITNSFRISNIDRLLDSISNGIDNYYLFVGDHFPHSNTEIQVLYNTVNDIRLYPYDQMIMGKKIYRTDVAPVIRYIPWASKQFAMWDHDDPNLPSSDYFCMVDEGSYIHVWKCLDNNNGANSTVIPSFAEGSHTSLYQTSDGYRWKYMTSVSSNVAAKFSTSIHFPLFANNQMSNTAMAPVNGRIDIIKIDAHQYGSRYDNYIDGTFRADDISVEGDNKLLNISNNIVNTLDGFYTGCILYITGGVGAGQYKKIVDYQSNTTGNIIQIDSVFLIPPQNGSIYEIRPGVNVVGDGRQSINCVARALVNSLHSNSVFRIEVLEFGKDYVTAHANVVANGVVALDPLDIAIIRPIMGPYGGHGYNPFVELQALNVEFSVTLANTENNTLPTSNQFQQVGILKNPLFQNVELSFAQVNGYFTSGEALLRVSPVRLNMNATVTKSSQVITCNTATFLTQARIGGQFIVSTTDGVVNQLITVGAITNVTSINAVANVTFSSNSAIMYMPNIAESFECKSVANNTVITVTNCPPTLGPLSMVMGIESGAIGTLSNIKRNGVVKGFDTFIQMYKYDATSISGTFLNNEIINQGEEWGYVHHTEGTTNISLYLSNMSQVFQANATIVQGNTSGATAQIMTKYEPETIPSSGAVQHLENIAAVERANNQSETFKIIVNF